MQVVIDASVTLAWCLPDEQADISDAVLGLAADSHYVVPPIWWYEIRNILIVAQRRGRIQSDDNQDFLSDLQALPIDVDTDWQQEGVLEIASEQRLSVYDASYLELALRRDATLATLDRKLWDAAATMSVTVFAS